MARLRAEGYIPGVVEKFVAFPPPGHRVDLFGFIDIVAMKPPEKGLLAVQATSTPNLMARVKKAQGCPELAAWIDSGNRFECHGWAKRGKEGKRKLWTLKRLEVSATDFKEIL